MRSIQILTLTVFIAVSSQSKAQDTVSDTVKVQLTEAHSPSKAALFSTAVPGLGQGYNKKYWKIPVIYAGIGVSLYFAITNHNNFKKFKTAYGLRIDDDASTIDEFDGRLSDNGLIANIDFHQRNRDLAYIIAGLFYLLNIVDAAVDAHLFNFPKNDNLSFNLHPSLELTNNNGLSKGFKLVIKL